MSGIEIEGPHGASWVIDTLCRRCMCERDFSSFALFMSFYYVNIVNNNNAVVSVLRLNLLALSTLVDLELPHTKIL